MVNAKFNDNIFYGVYAGGQNRTEYNGGWDSFTARTVASIITMGPLDSTTAADLLGHASSGPGDPAAELLRKVEVKNNVYFWPAALTAFWTAWNDTATVDTIYTPVFMNSQSINMFTDKAKWPGFIESGNQNVDPSFGPSIPGVLNAGTGNANGVGLLNWFRAVRSGTGTTETYGYQFTQVGNAANWTPPWPLPETNDMKYSNMALMTGATDGKPIGDLNWFGLATRVESPKQTGSLPENFALRQNYPNPFNPTTSITYEISKPVEVKLSIYNVHGQKVRTLVNGRKAAGSYTIQWDGRDQSGQAIVSGIYFYKLEAGAFVQTRKMLFVK
jgi:hypothetical protein